jgi:transposase
MRAKPWDVSDALWERIEPLLPRRSFGGNARAALTGTASTALGLPRSSQIRRVLRERHLRIHRFTEVAGEQDGPCRLSAKRRQRRAESSFEVHARVRISHRLVRRNLTTGRPSGRRTRAAVAVCWNRDRRPGPVFAASQRLRLPRLRQSGDCRLRVVLVSGPRFPVLGDERLRDLT